MLDSPEENPDRSGQYKQRSDGMVENVHFGTLQHPIDQLNEAFRQIRLMRTALRDRDEVIAELHGAIKKRDHLITELTTSIKLSNRARPFLFAFFGGAATALGTWVLERLVH